MLKFIFLKTRKKNLTPVKEVPNLIHRSRRGPAVPRALHRPLPHPALHPVRETGQTRRPRQKWRLESVRRRSEHRGGDVRPVQAWLPDGWL